MGDRRTGDYGCKTVQEVFLRGLETLHLCKPFEGIY